MNSNFNESNIALFHEFRFVRAETAIFGNGQDAVILTIQPLYRKECWVTGRKM